LESTDTRATNPVGVLEERGEITGHVVFASNRAGLRALDRWSQRFTNRRSAVDSSAGRGRPLAQRLLTSGEQVVDVPAKLSARWRLLSTGNERKDDAADATTRFLLRGTGNALRRAPRKIM
jgi:transposase